MTDNYDLAWLGLALTIARLKRRKLSPVEPADTPIRGAKALPPSLESSRAKEEPREIRGLDIGKIPAQSLQHFAGDVRQ